jgi:hypothetical protein
VTILSALVLILSVASAEGKVDGQAADVQALGGQIGDTTRFKGFVEGSKPLQDSLAAPAPSGPSTAYLRQGRLRIATQVVERGRLDSIDVPLVSKGGGQSAPKGMTYVGQVALGASLGTAILLVVIGNLREGSGRRRKKLHLPAHEPRPEPAPAFRPDLEPLPEDLDA